MGNYNLEKFVAESNSIEGITRSPTDKELITYEKFMNLNFFSLADLQNLVSVVQPGAILRNKEGLDVRIGKHFPPSGGPLILKNLEELIIVARSLTENPFTIHVMYEDLHPFTDGNGRSGRAIWAWMMVKQYGGFPLGFLHHWYYQSLENIRI